MHAGLGTQHGKGLEENSWTIWGGTAVVCAGLEMAHLDCVALLDLDNSLEKNPKTLDIGTSLPDRKSVV